MSRRPGRRQKSSPKPRGRAGGKRVRVKTAKGRKISSTRWLDRQLNDPYVAEAKRQGYRSRAAFKLAELDERFDLLRGAKRVVDLGAAPGGWTQLARDRCARGATIVAVDIQEIEPIEGVVTLQLDIFDEAADERILDALGGPADIVISDMAAAATGHAGTDHLRTMALCEAALESADRLLRPGGAFLCKVLQGGTESELLAGIRKRFRKVRHVKPPASRADSRELYFVATGYRGSDKT